MNRVASFTKHQYKRMHFICSTAYNIFWWRASKWWITKQTNYRKRNWEKVINQVEESSGVSWVVIDTSSLNQTMDAKQIVSGFSPSSVFHNYSVWVIHCDHFRFVSPVCNTRSVRQTYSNLLTQLKINYEMLFIICMFLVLIAFQVLSRHCVIVCGV